MRGRRLVGNPHHQITTSPDRQLPRLSLCLCASLVALSSGAQTLDERLDEEKFLRGLSEYRLPDVLDHYIREHPPANEIDATLYAMTVLRMRLSDETLTPEQHRSAVEQVLATRDELIENHSDDPRHGVWLAEQAADLLFAMYPLEAAGLASEFGLVSPGHRAQAAEVAKQIHQLALDAEIEIEETILNMEGEPGYQDDVAAQLRRRRLAREERDRRIPFLRGAGEYLHSLHNLSDDPPAQRAGFERAAEILIAVIPELEGSARARAQVYAGLALARLAQFTEAEEHLSAAIAAEGAQPIDQFAARMGRVVNAEASSGAAAALQALVALEAEYSRPDALFFRILVADRELLLRRSVARTSPPAQRAQILRSAFEEFLSLLEQPAFSGVSEETLRGILYAKLASAIDESVPVGDLPPIALIALAESLSRDESTRDEGIAMFERALEGEGLDDQARAAAIFGLARAHYAAENWLEAAKRFDQIGRELPADPQADRALNLAATLLQELHDRTEASADVLSQYERTLTYIVESRPQHADLEKWRYALGLLRYEQDRRDEAAALFEAVPADSPIKAEAALMLARLARDEAKSAGSAADAHERSIDLARSARGLLETAIAGVDDASNQSQLSRLREYLALTRIFEAEAQLALGRAEETITLLADYDGASDLPRSILADALSLRIRAYQLTGRDEEARAEVDQFIRSIPEEIDLVVPEMMASLSAEIEGLLRQNEVERARERAESDLLPLAQTLRSWMARSDPAAETRAIMLVRIGDAHRLAGQFLEALEIYEQALVDDPTLLSAVFGRAEARFGLTQFEEAIADYKRISAARRAQLDEYFWRSELRMLQVLDLVNRNTHQIAPRIARLRIFDADLGGYQPDFAILENKYAGR
jgi:tetratricopeptide (TPR) repeat protein